MNLANLKLELKDTLLFSSHEIKIDKTSYGYLSKWGTINDLKFLSVEIFRV